MLGKGVAVVVGWGVGVGKTAVFCAGSVGGMVVAVGVGRTAVVCVGGVCVGWVETAVCCTGIRLMIAKINRSTISGINM